VWSGNHEAPHYAVFSSPLLLLTFSPQISSSASHCQTSSAYVLPSVWVFTPLQTINEIRSLYILRFIFVDRKWDKNIPDGIVSGISWVIICAYFFIMQNFVQFFRFSVYWYCTNKSRQQKHLWQKCKNILCWVIVTGCKTEKACHKKLIEKICYVLRLYRFIREIFG
jgi:hypothetical protein